jgi:hypothetical protein
MLNDTSQCYKFYWLEAVIRLLVATDDDIGFDQIINEMICEAWYSVTQYHLHMGPTINGKSENYLEHAIKVLESDPALPQPATKEEILVAIKRNEQEIRSDKVNLTLNVPYRLISSFLDGLKGSDSIWNQFEKCRRDNLNAIWATENLYIEGNTKTEFTNIIGHYLKPLYDSALLQGYSLWKLSEIVTH